jgi:hypothetical protein
MPAASVEALSKKAIVCTPAEHAYSDIVWTVYLELMEVPCSSGMPLFRARNAPVMAGRDATLRPSSSLRWWKRFWT